MGFRELRWDKQKEQGCVARFVGGCEAAWSPGTNWAIFESQDCKLAEKDCCVQGEGTLLTVCSEPVCKGFSIHGVAGWTVLFTAGGGLCAVATAICLSECARGAQGHMTVRLHYLLSWDPAAREL